MAGLAVLLLAASNQIVNQSSSITGSIVGTVTLSELSSFSVTGPSVTYSGALVYVEINPVCVTLPLPCKLPSFEQAYLQTSSDLNYRLFFASAPNIVNGTEVRVTGVLVVPSSWNYTAWQPALHFAGDIYVQTIIRV